MRAGIPVLVESGRLHTEPDLAGVLPRFRAMPCHFTELLKLARHLLSRERPYRSEHFGTPRTLSGSWKKIFAPSPEGCASNRWNRNNH